MNNKLLSRGHFVVHLIFVLTDVQFVLSFFFGAEQKAGYTFYIRSC